MCVEMGDAVELRVCGGYAHHKRAYTHPSLSSKRKVVNLRPTSARCLPGEGGFGFMHFSARIDPPYPMCGVRCNLLNCKLTQDHFVQPLRDQKMPRDRIRGVRE